MTRCLGLPRSSVRIPLLQCLCVILSRGESFFLIWTSKPLLTRLTLVSATDPPTGRQTCQGNKNKRARRNLRCRRVTGEHTFLEQVLHCGYVANECIYVSWMWWSDKETDSRNMWLCLHPCSIPTLYYNRGRILGTSHQPHILHLIV